MKYPKKLAREYNKKYLKTKFSKLLKIIPKRGKLLDIGCESGDTTDFLRLNGYDVKGVDIDAKAIKRAKKYHPDTKFAVGDLYKTDFSKYDVYFLWGVFEFVFDLKKELQKIKKEMKPGACIVFSVPNICSLSKRIRCFLGTNPKRDTSSFRVYTQDQIREIVKSVGFRKFYITGTGVDCIKNRCVSIPNKLSTDIIVKVIK